jgi:hypothetical protein
MRLFSLFSWALATPLLVVLFLGIVIGIPLRQVSQSVTEREVVKEWLGDSQLYENIVPLAGELLVESTKDLGGKNYLLDIVRGIDDKESETGQAIRDVITPQYAQATLEEGIVDGLYDWLEGVTSRPLFEVKLFKDRATFRTFLSTALKERVGELSPCPANYQVSGGFNPLDTNCRPRGLSDGQLKKAVDSFFNKFSKTKEFDDLFRLTSLSSKNLIKIDEDTSERFQQGFSLLKMVPIVASTLIVFFAVLLIITVPSFRQGLRTTGIASTLAAAVLLGIKLLASRSFEVVAALIGDEIPVGFDSSREVILNLVETVYQYLLTGIGGDSLVVLVGGLILTGLGFLRIRRKRKKRYQAPPLPQPEEVATSPQPPA